MTTSVVCVCIYICKICIYLEERNIVVVVIIVIDITRHKVVLEVHIFLLNSAENMCFCF